MKTHIPRLSASLIGLTIVSAALYISVVQIKSTILSVILLIMQVVCAMALIINLLHVRNEMKVMKFLKRMTVTKENHHAVLDEMNRLPRRQDLVHHLANHGKTKLNDIISFVSWADTHESGVLDDIERIHCRYAEDISKDEDKKLAIFAVIKTSNGTCSQPLIISTWQMIKIIDKLYSGEKKNEE